jgi:hypothetical protein
MFTILFQMQFITKHLVSKRQYLKISTPMENIKPWIKDSILSIFKKDEIREKKPKPKFSNRKTKDQYLKVIGSKVYFIIIFIDLYHNNINIYLSIFYLLKGLIMTLVF